MNSALHSPASLPRPARTRPLLLHPAAKPVLCLVRLTPLAWLVFGALAYRLGAIPAEALIQATGDWALRFLRITLVVTPLRQLTGQAALTSLARWCAFAACSGCSRSFKAACTSSATAGSTRAWC